MAAVPSGGGGRVICFPLLDASSHLYKRVCPSVGRLVGRSVMRNALGLVKKNPRTRAPSTQNLNSQTSGFAPLIFLI